MAYQETLRDIKRGLVRLGAGGLLVVTGCAPTSTQIIERAITLPSRGEEIVLRGDDFLVKRFSDDSFLLQTDTNLNPYSNDALERGAKLIASACGGIKKIGHLNDSAFDRRVIIAVTDGSCFPQLK